MNADAKPDARKMSTAAALAEREMFGDHYVAALADTKGFTVADLMLWINCYEGRACYLRRIVALRLPIPHSSN